MKYLIASDSDFPKLAVAILFDSMLSHQTMARGLNVVSAGFVEIRGRKRNCGDKTDLDVYCHGESESLGLKSRGPVDSAIIASSAHRGESP